MTAQRGAGMLLTPTEIGEAKSRLEALQAEARAMAGRYESAKRQLDSPGRTDDVAALQAEVNRLVRSFAVGDTGEKAIGILARAGYVLERMVEPELIVRGYEEHQKLIEAERARIARAKQIRANATT